MQTKTKKITGIVLLAYPIPLLIFTIIGYAVFAFAYTSKISTNGGPYEVTKFIFTVQSILSLLGLISVVGLFIGIPVGTWMYVSARKQEKQPLQVSKN